jgi:SAM-dependent methyltransferase
VTGLLAEIWKLEWGIYPTCVEVDPKLIEILRSNGFDAYLKVNQVREKFSLVYSSNVLEHIEDDVEALKTMKQAMVPGGYLGIYVPALPFIYSNLDKNVGHFRRYRRRELIQKVQDAGFQVESCYYNDSIGVLASLAIRIFGYKNDMKLGSLGSIIFYDR